MGKRGPIRQPENAAKSKGTYRKHRYVNDLPVTPELPPPPPWLTCERSIAHWERIGPMLVEKRLLCQLDADTFAMMCKTLSELQECNEQIAQDGTFLVGSKGSLVAHPGVAIRNRLRTDFLRYAREFGMTYSSRIGLGSGEKQDEADPIEEMLKRVMGEG